MSKIKYHRHTPKQLKDAITITKMPGAALTATSKASLPPWGLGFNFGEH
jgi:hypothetical protein